jgi:hypothetical protein
MEGRAGACWCALVLQTTSTATVNEWTSTHLAADVEGTPVLPAMWLAAARRRRRAGDALRRVRVSAHGRRCAALVWPCRRPAPRNRPHARGPGRVRGGMSRRGSCRVRAPPPLEPQDECGRRLAGSWGRVTVEYYGWACRICSVRGALALSSPLCCEEPRQLTLPCACDVAQS